MSETTVGQRTRPGLRESLDGEVPPARASSSVFETQTRSQRSVQIGSMMVSCYAAADKVTAPLAYPSHLCLA
jgi:hypothetical protein